METKNPDDFVLKELDSIQLKNHFLVSPHSPGGGGLALFWSQEVNVSILLHSNNFIDTLITFKGTSFHVSFIYGALDISRRH